MRAFSLSGRIRSISPGMIIPETVHSDSLCLPLRVLLLEKSNEWFAANSVKFMFPFRKRWNVPEKFSAVMNIVRLIFPASILPECGWY